MEGSRPEQDILLAKLGAVNRTEAVARGQALGLLGQRQLP
jgi:hypothetical protein